MLKVTVGITTYNLEKYIEKAIDSILCQKTNFEFKIVIADDGSTDGTVNILKKYAEKYPEKIEIMLSSKNLGSLANSNRIFEKIDGEYISFLDGDDYWIRNDRLQKQVDYLDNHPECCICAGNTQYLIEGETKETVVKPQKTGVTYSFDDYLKGKVPFFHTSSILLRNVIFKNGLPECYKNAVGTFEECALRGEDFRRILHLEQGNAYIMREVVSVYRIHDKGIWQGSTEIRRALESAISTNFYYKYYGEKYGDFFSKSAKKSYQNLILTLLTDQQFGQAYFLCPRDNQLFVELLNDLSKHNTCEHKQRVNKWYRRILRKILEV